MVCLLQTLRIRIVFCGSVNECWRNAFSKNDWCWSQNQNKLSIHLRFRLFTYLNQSSFFSLSFHILHFACSLSGGRAPRTMSLVWLRCVPAPQHGYGATSVDLVGSYGATATVRACLWNVRHLLLSPHATPLHHVIIQLKCTNSGIHNIVDSTVWHVLYFAICFPTCRDIAEQIPSRISLWTRCRSCIAGAIHIVKTKTQT